MKTKITKDTLLCMSLSSRPGNFGTRFQNYLYEKLNLDFIYKAFTTTDIESSVKGIRALGIRGCAISMPFKESCMEFLDHIDPSAAGIKSVNTIVNTDGRLVGSNTDYIAVKELLQASGVPSHSSFALFGSGGMAKAVACALKDLGFRSGYIVARNEVTGTKLARKFGFEWVPSLEKSCDILINVSPVGMAGGPEEKQIPFSERFVSEANTIFDVVAIPMETPLIELARKKNKNVISGFEVITLQAVEQFVLYTGVRPDDKLIRDAANFARS